jgi:hypothetical protein
VKDHIPAAGVVRADSAAAAEVMGAEGAKHPLPTAGGVATSLVWEEESQVPLAAAEGR